MMNAFPRHFRSGSSAFTLIEVLVASAVLAIVMAILLGTLSTSMTLWRTTESKLGADREGRAGESLMVDDLSSALMPASTNYWPRVRTNGEFVFLQFLTTRSLEYQPTNEGNLGDVCFVEYFFPGKSPDKGGALWRNFYASGWTYTNVLKKGKLPEPLKPDTSAITDLTDLATNPQVLSVSLLTDGRDAVRGLSVYDEASTNCFVVLATNNPSSSIPGDLLPHSGDYSVSNPPVAIEVNFAAADAETLANSARLGDANFRLRNAGYYSFRVKLPKVGGNR